MTPGGPHAARGKRLMRRRQVERRARFAAQLIQRGYHLREIAAALGDISHSALFASLQECDYPTRSDRPALIVERHGDTYVLVNRAEIDAAIRRYDHGAGDV